LTSTQPATDSYPVGIAVSATELRVDTVAASVSASGGAGSVTSIGVSSSDLTVTGSPVTTTGSIDLSATATLPVAKGGTGQTVKASAFNALAPSTAAGSLLFRNASTAVALAPSGTSGAYLVADSTADAGVSWQPFGTVTSFGLSSSAAGVFTITNSPITSGSGTIGLDLNLVSGAVGGTGLTSTAGEGSTLIGTVASPAAYTSQYSSLSWRNRITNGSMAVAQRGTAAVTTDMSFPVDRWMVRNATSAVISAQRTSNFASGWFTHALSFTVTTGASATASQLVAVRQNIEGYNVADLAWGTADAKPVTLSFFASSSLAGTYGVRLANADGTRSYVATVSLTASFVRYTITIPGDTSGTWLTNNNTGLIVLFDLGSGTDWQAPGTGAWLPGNYTTTSSRANFIGTTSAVFRLSGVQLEAGSVATMLETRSIEKETELCQRYFQRIAALGTLTSFGCGSASTTTNGLIWVPYAVPMRGVPTVSQSSAQLYDIAARTISALSTASYGDMGLSINITSTGLTQNRATLWTGSSSTGYIDLNAEI
jgi:hypothetical protein